MGKSSAEDKILAEKIVAVTVFKSEKEVRPTIEALLKGGVSTVELALRSPYSADAVKLVASEYPQMLLGIGTVIEPDQVDMVCGLGAAFAVAPGLNRRVMDRAGKAGLPFFPGVATPSEIETALEYGVRLLKFFPAEPMGGLKYLKSINAPYAHLGLRYIPLGGVSQSNLAEYLSQEMIGAVGGSWIASRTLIEAGDWDRIEQNAAKAAAVGKRF